MVEVCWLFEDEPRIEAQFLDAIAADAFDPIPVTRADVARMAELVRQYADFPLGAVDASLVALAERLKLREIVTLDRRHFSAVRGLEVGRAARARGGAEALAGDHWAARSPQERDERPPVLEGLSAMSSIRPLLSGV